MLIVSAVVVLVIGCSFHVNRSQASNIPHSDKMYFSNYIPTLTRACVTSASLFTLLKMGTISAPFSKKIVTQGPQSDIYYPTTWLGSWRTIRTITDIVSPSSSSTGDGMIVPPHFMKGLRVGDQFSYIASYVPYRDRVVRDRSKRSHLSEYSALQAVVFWEPDNPNSLEIRFEDRSVRSFNC